MIHPGSNRLRVSMRDIARMVGVSHVAVSLALRDHPRVSAEMRQRIQEAADLLGYQSDPMLAGLASFRNAKTEASIRSAIGWITAPADSEVFPRREEIESYQKGAGEAAEKYGYRLEEIEIDREKRSTSLHRILATRGIRGILLPTQTDQADWADFPWERYSIVRLGHSLGDPRTHKVTSDLVAGTTMGFRQIRNRGYRRIGFITNEQGRHPRHHPCAGAFLLAQREVAESERIPSLVMADHRSAEQQSALDVWLKTHRPDAIFTNVAEIPQVLESMGVKVPEDIALITTNVRNPGIDAGIQQHFEEIGRVGLLTLHSLLCECTYGVPSIIQHILVEGRWIDGANLPNLLQREEESSN